MRTHQYTHWQVSEPKTTMTGWCRTCPWVMNRTTEESIRNHARNNPGHRVQFMETVTRITEVIAQPVMQIQG